MRIIVFSDVHGHSDYLMKLLNTHPEADAYIFCGDGIRKVKKVFEAFPNFRLFSTPGNCDSFEEETLKISEFGDIKIAFCHGHGFGVKYGIERLLSLAIKSGANILLFGHTHNAVCKFSKGIYYMNPGAIADGSNIYFGIIDISTDGSIACSITSIRYPSASK